MAVYSMKLLWIFLQIAIGYHLLTPMLLYLFYRLKRSFTTGESNTVPSETGAFSYDYALIVTAYEETTMLRNVVDSLLKLDYDNYLIYIVADNCDVSTLHFEDERVILLKPDQVLANNIKSHQYAIQRFRRSHDKVAIIDSDNLVDNRFIVEMNEVFARGFEAVQGFRAAKNLNTDYARLDAARDLFYHFYDGKLLFGVGSSATLAGSGMAFNTSLYVSCIADMVVQGAGFDKVLQARIVASGGRIGFTDRAVIYDQKTTYRKQLVNQRARWINSWFKYASLGFGLVWKGIRNTNVNQGIFGLVLLRPPLFIFLILSVICLIINVLSGQSGVIYWVIGLSAFLVSFFIALVEHQAKSVIYRSLLKIPLFVFYQLVSLANIRRLVRQSVATKHDQK